ncbi:unnamed protein product [Bursaphelenchus okinawaensis]|uniref:Uncharacterized protein n=1 Tax=Bursaphelenchus okinawaensis TaxID=465554 RepID=A0A811L3K0_9BILA|nr:unnamed protein product [Bursaphelenchus okinawaensis]CAG9115420.1 unnamed protein product [Bursaphelenchus okinawaensis]
MHRSLLIKNTLWLVNDAWKRPCEVYNILTGNLVLESVYGLRFMAPFLIQNNDGSVYKFNSSSGTWDYTGSSVPVPCRVLKEAPNFLITKKYFFPQCSGSENNCEAQSVPKYILDVVDKNFEVAKRRDFDLCPSEDRTGWMVYSGTFIEEKRNRKITTLHYTAVCRQMHPLLEMSHLFMFEDIRMYDNNEAAQYYQKFIDDWCRIEKRQSCI